MNPRAPLEAKASHRPHHGVAAPLQQQPSNFPEIGLVVASPSPATTCSPQLGPCAIERMRELDILYDEVGGLEFLHFYTAHVGPSLFFEVVERRGGYDAYGTVNSPVRVAAQRQRVIAAASGPPCRHPRAPASSRV
jgi:hypothetical protein